jgi:hypothetical protein
MTFEVSQDDYLRKMVADRDALLKAAEKVIEMNLQKAQDQYGDRNKAESWACVRVLREAIARMEA